MSVSAGRVALGVALIISLAVAAPALSQLDGTVSTTSGAHPDGSIAWVESRYRETSRTLGVVRQEFDTEGRETYYGINYCGSSPNHEQHREYDHAGRIVSTTFRAGSEPNRSFYEYAEDGSGILVAVDLGNDGWIDGLLECALNEVGNVQVMVSPEGSAPDVVCTLNSTSCHYGCPADCVLGSDRPMAERLHALQPFESRVPETLPSVPGALVVRHCHSQTIRPDGSLELRGCTVDPRACRAPAAPESRDLYPPDCDTY